MPSDVLSRERADELYRSPKYIVGNNISWEGNGKFRRYIIIQLIGNNENINMKIKGWHSWKVKDRYGFSFLCDEIPIRRWDDREGHYDPISRNRMNGPHKHYHDPLYGDRCSYEVNDVRVNDVNGALLDFLRECNISTEHVITETNLGDFNEL